MLLGVVFHKNPLLPATGIDLVRLRAITGGLIKAGVRAEVIAPVENEALLDGFIPVKPLSVLTGSAPYDLLKTSYHFSIKLIGDYAGPVVSRIVRVVDERYPQRDVTFRQELLQCQERIRDRASGLILNNPENEIRWRDRYGDSLRIALIPNAAPARIPAQGANPYEGREPAVLFLGSLAAGRMVRILNDLAETLQGEAFVHFVGLNKCSMYGEETDCRLAPLVTDHGERPEQEVWDFIRYAKVGLALATGPLRFDNDISKIFNYLRGGLPVLSESPIVNNHLIYETGHGSVFEFDDFGDMISKLRGILENPPGNREAVMEFMIREHSWDTRVETYRTFLQETLGR